LNSEPRWKAPQVQQLRLVPLDNDYAAFNPLSGETHILNALSKEILQLLHERDGLSASQIFDAFSDGTDSPELNTFHRSLKDHLADLDQLGLITQTDD